MRLTGRRHALALFGADTASRGTVRPDRCKSGQQEDYTWNIGRWSPRLARLLAHSSLRWRRRCWLRHRCSPKRRPPKLLPSPKPRLRLLRSRNLRVLLRPRRAATGRRAAAHLLAVDQVLPEGSGKPAPSRCASLARTAVSRSGMPVVAAVLIEPDGETKNSACDFAARHVNSAWHTRYRRSGQPMTGPYVICFQNGCVIAMKQAASWSGN
jgi:hypothetical protein